VSKKLLPVSELKGYKSYTAMIAFQHLMIGLKMLPAYLGESYEDFFERIQAMPSEDQIKILYQAAAFVKLDEEDLACIICFCKDKNGVPFSAQNLKSLGPDELMNVIVSVCAEIVKINIGFLSEKEKKNSTTSQLT
jgi:hypothetical protein